MKSLQAPGQAPHSLREAAEGLESLLVKQVLKSSGAFKGASGVAGAEVRSDLFVEAIAEAVVEAGGFGLADHLEQQLTPSVNRVASHPSDEILAEPPRRDPLRSVQTAAAFKAYHGGVD